jgi:predicted AlkP superfamily pyrophosphatase or phosphodiesterase
MSWLARLASASLVLVLATLVEPLAVARSGDVAPILVLLSLDGWRWDYHTKAPTPNLRRVMARGVRAERLVPVFPSKTFPNHYSIVTGLYAEHHGIVGNTMREPGTDLRFALSNRDAVGDTRWWQGEPIWVTAGRHGRRTATLFWPGSEAAVAGARPDDWTLYDGSIPNHERVVRILRWLDLPASRRPSLITGYFSDTDDAGHDEGPESTRVRDAIGTIDAAIGELTAGIAARGLEDRVNVVIVSDHGMAATFPDRVIVLADHVAPDSVDIVELGPNLGLNPLTGSVDDLYRRLAHAHPHLRVYRRSDTPARWRYRTHPRIPALVGVVDEGWTLVRDRSRLASATSNRGNHGFDPGLRSMHGLFVAAGPAFRRGAVVPPFENVHIYNALAAALDIPPAPNDGDPAVAGRLLK